RKHLFARCSLGNNTVRRIPISPVGCLSSGPSIHVQAGGQLGSALEDMSGLSRSNLVRDLLALRFTVNFYNSCPRSSVRNPTLGIKARAERELGPLLLSPSFLAIFRPLWLRSTS